MQTAALITWLLTIGGGATLATIWVAKGGLRQQPDDPPRPPAEGAGTTRVVSALPLWMVASHALVALTGLGLFVWYITAGDGDQVGAERAPWIIVGALVITAGIGLAMGYRWAAARKRRRQGGPATRRSAAADQSIPALFVHGHGLFALATIVLVLLIALDIGT